MHLVVLLIGLLYGALLGGWWSFYTGSLVACGWMFFKAFSRSTTPEMAVREPVHSPLQKQITRFVEIPGCLDHRGRTVRGWIDAETSDGYMITLSPRKALSGTTLCIPKANARICAHVER